jgi:hypothetical protein
MSSLNPHCSPVMKVPFPLLSRWGNWGTERVMNLSRSKVLTYLKFKIKFKFPTNWQSKDSNPGSVTQPPAQGAYSIVMVMGHGAKSDSTRKSLWSALRWLHIFWGRLTPLQAEGKCSGRSTIRANPWRLRAVVLQLTGVFTAKMEPYSTSGKSKQLMVFFSQVLPSIFFYSIDAC